MKKILFLATMLCAGFAFTSCQSDDEDNTCVITFEGDDFTALVDTVQFGGPLVYSATDYAWCDVLTSLSGRVEKDDWSQWGMGYGWKRGFAISNYVDASETVDYDKQLAVPASNGSKNFAVCYADSSLIRFNDGIARTVQSIDVCPNTFLLRNMEKNAKDGYLFKAILTFTHADGSKTTRDFVFANGTSIVKTWRTVSLADVMPFVSMMVTFDGTDKNAWGLLTPTYMAIDNIKVQL